MVKPPNPTLHRTWADRDYDDAALLCRLQDVYQHLNTAWNARDAVVMGTLFVCAVDPNSAEAAEPVVASVRAANALEDAVCQFISKPDSDASQIERVVVALNLDCEIWVNVDGLDERLRSLPRNTCDSGWNVPGKGERVQRTYRTGGTRVNANYKVTDSCFIGDKCEYITFDATFRISKSGGTKTVQATGKCSW